MKKKILWMLASFLMILSLLIISCGPKAEEEAKVTTEGSEKVVITTGEEEKVEEEKVVEEEKGILPPEVPKYGGKMVVMSHPIYAFNPFTTMHTNCGSIYLSNEELFTGDWAKGPEGTGEVDYLLSFGGRMELMKGRLAESWDLPDDETIIFHIRKGIHWWNKPPTNGRELTADDIVWTLNKAFTSPQCYFNQFTLRGQNPTSVKALDKYTVEVKFPADIRGMMLLELGDYCYYFPKDITEQVDLGDWKNAIGTGAWIPTDFVESVSATYKRNPDYWQNDPVHPENQLPYPDEMLGLLITDLSTRQAAFRTGKLDQMGNVNWEDFDMFMKQCPELEYIQSYPDMPRFLAGRVDIAPFNDIRVRQALNMAVNMEEIKDDYYGGYADLLGYPCPNVKTFKDMYVPLEQQPEAVQELFRYNPEKAKQLLAEAGYPNGFKTKVQTTSAYSDFMSIIREYFLKVGVDMEIEVLEASALSGITGSNKHEAMLVVGGKTSHPYMLLNVRNPGSLDNRIMYTDPRVEECYLAISRAMGKDDAEVARQVREIGPFLLEQAWAVWLPVPYTYTMWWPWFQNYHGEQDIGYCNQYRQWTYTWIDETLKKSMGY
jgi:peptide/nickel transport system substrate-binding protein